MKTLSYDCGNPVLICLRANARSAFLFTGSPRSARDDKGGESDNYELTLSLRRSTINVENVVVRLWQSSLNMSAGIRPQCFFIYWIATVVSLPRDDKGE